MKTKHPTRVRSHSRGWYRDYVYKLHRKWGDYCSPEKQFCSNIQISHHKNVNRSARLCFYSAVSKQKPRHPCQHFCRRKCKVAASPYCATTSCIKAWPLWFWYNHHDILRMRHTYTNTYSSSYTGSQLKFAVNQLKKRSSSNHIWSSHGAFKQRI